jgi:hypothetical protein
MTIVQIQHEVRDFDAWKRAFDQDPLRRGRGGVGRHVMYRAAGKPNFVLLQLEFEKREDADAYLMELERMLPTVDDAVGFSAPPRAWLLEQVEQRTY